MEAFWCLLPRYNKEVYSANLRTLHLDEGSKMTILNQSECVIYALRSHAKICFWHCLPIGVISMLKLSRLLKPVFYFHFWTIFFQIKFVEAFVHGTPGRNLSVWPDGLIVFSITGRLQKQKFTRYQKNFQGGFRILPNTK